MMQNKYSLESIANEHENIRNLVNSVGNTMSDLDALFRLETEHFELSQTSLQSLLEKSKKLNEMIDDLWKDLKEHFNYEEQHFTVVLGDTLAKALMIEHKGIAREIENVKDIITKSSFEGLSQPEMLERKTILHEAIGKLCRIIEEHAKDEDVLIKLVNKAVKE